LLLREWQPIAVLGQGGGIQANDQAHQQNSLELKGFSHSLSLKRMSNKDPDHIIGSTEKTT
jgi:hypothetical protein